MNNNIILSYPNRATAATITGGSWSASLPAQNVANKEMWKVARSTNATLANTKFTADLGSAKQVRCVALANHNLSADALVLTKIMGESGNPNLLTYSEQLWNPALWVTGSILGNFFTVTASTEIPDVYGGASSVAKFVAGASTAELFLRKHQTWSANTYAPSIFIYVPVQAGVTSWSLLSDFQDSTLSSVITFTTFDSWVRVLIPTTTTIATKAFVDFNIYRNGTSPTTGFTFYATCAQLEVGTVATTYKPTTSAASNIALHYSSGWKPAWRMAFDNLVEWESAVWWVGTAGDEYLRSPYAVTAIADDTYLARYISVEINDTANADGYVQIGRLFVGGALQPTYNPSYGLQDGLQDLSTVDAAESGAMWGNEKRRMRYTSFVLPYTTPTEAAYLHEMQRSLGTIGEVLYIPYPADPSESQRWGYIGRMSELSPIDYPYYRVRSLALKLEEIA